MNKQTNINYTFQPLPQQTNQIINNLLQTKYKINYILIPITN